MYTLSFLFFAALVVPQTAYAKARHHTASSPKLQTASSITTIAAGPTVDTGKTNDVYTIDSKWTEQFSSRYEALATTFPGAEGSGSGVSVGFRVQTPQTAVGQFSDTFDYWHVNTVTIYPGLNGTTWTQPYNFNSYENMVQYDVGPPACKWGAGVGYYSESPYGQNSGYTTRGLGWGIDKFQDPTHTYSLFGGVHYYGNISGGMNGATGGFKLVRSQIGISYQPDLKIGLSYQLGFRNDLYVPNTNSSGNSRIFGGFAGLGYNFR